MSGFMNSSNGESSRSNDRSVRHVMINQLSSLEMLGEGFELDGKPLKNVLVVGTVTEFSMQNNRATVEIADGTGSLSATVWNVSDDNPLELQYGQYACLYVEVRQYQEKTRFTANHVIQPIPFSQVLFHEVCALKEHVTNTGRAPTEATGSGASKPAEGYGNDMFGESERLTHDLTNILGLEGGHNIEFLSRQLNVSKDKLSAVLQELDNMGTIWNDGELWYLTAD